MAGVAWPRPLRDLYLAPNLRAVEVACRCCGIIRLTPELGLAVECFQRFRDLVGQPVIVTSGGRCEAHNARVGGAPRSRHKHWAAFDVVVAGKKPEQLAPLARQAGFKEVICERNEAGEEWLHMDV